MISGLSKKQQVVAHVSSDILWVQNLLQELKAVTLTIVPFILCDNLSTVSLAHIPVWHCRMEHRELDLLLFKEKVITKKLPVQHVPAMMQIADTLTKQSLQLGLLI